MGVWQQRPLHHSLALYQVDFLSHPYSPEMNRVPMLLMQLTEKKLLKKGVNQMGVKEHWRILQ